MSRYELLAGTLIVYFLFIFAGALRIHDRACAAGSNCSWWSIAPLSELHWITARRLVRNQRIAEADLEVPANVPAAWRVFMPPRDGLVNKYVVKTVAAAMPLTEEAVRSLPDITPSPGANLYVAAVGGFNPSAVALVPQTCALASCSTGSAPNSVCSPLIGRVEAVVCAEQTAKNDALACSVIIQRFASVSDPVAAASYTLKQVWGTASKVDGDRSVPNADDCADKQPP
jgi:hypothetical protein